MSLHTQKNHYAAIEDVHVNLENRNHAFDEYGYGPLNPKEPSDDFWKHKAKVFNTTPEEAKKSRCGNCAAFNQSKEIMKRIADGLGPAGNIVAEKTDLGFCEMFKFKCAAERTCDAWLVNGPITEGESWWDSVSAFGRQAADTATLGGYKYARAGVDYAAKNTASALGYGKGTTYDREIKQEKEKLAHDDKEHKQASSAGKLAGYGAMAVAPNVPGAASALAVGEKAAKAPYYLGLAKRAIGLKENLAGAGTSADGGMSAPFSAMGQEIDARRKEKPKPLPKGSTMGSYVDEENIAGGGAVAGLGVGPQGEPGRPKELMPMVRRGKKFMGVETFIVPSRVFNQIREAKRRGKHWRKYLDEDDTFYHIRVEAKKNKRGAIIIEDENTGALSFARYGKNV